MPELQRQSERAREIESILSGLREAKAAVTILYRCYPKNDEFMDLTERYLWCMCTYSDQLCREAVKIRVEEAAKAMKNKEKP